MIIIMIMNVLWHSMLLVMIISIYLPIAIGWLIVLNKLYQLARLWWIHQHLVYHQIPQMAMRKDLIYSQNLDPNVKSLVDELMSEVGDG